jgi:hypothetical protein
MIIKTFLETVYEGVIKNFPDVSISYEYDEGSHTHFVKVTPQYVYESDAFLDFEAELNELWLAQVVHTPEEDFCIISTDSLIQLKQPQLVYIPEPIQAFSASGQELEQEGYKISYSSIKYTPEFKGLTSLELEPATSEQYSLAA